MKVLKCFPDLSKNSWWCAWRIDRNIIVSDVLGRNSGDFKKVTANANLFANVAYSWTRNIVCQFKRHEITLESMSKIKVKEKKVKKDLTGFMEDIGSCPFAHAVLHRPVAYSS